MVLFPWLPPNNALVNNQKSESMEWSRHVCRATFNIPQTLLLKKLVVLKTRRCTTFLSFFIDLRRVSVQSAARDSRGQDISPSSPQEGVEVAKEESKKRGLMDRVKVGSVIAVTSLNSPNDLCVSIECEELDS